MGGRYIISGAQLGSIKETAQTNPEELLNVINHVIGKQFVANSDNKILDDVEAYKKVTKTFDAFEEFPLREAPRIKRMASKAGHLVDEYVKIQDVHKAVEGCKKDLSIAEMPDHFVEQVFDRLDWWLTDTEVEKNG